MTRDELITALQQLRDEAAGVDTDVAAIAAVMMRMTIAGDDLAPLTAAALDVEHDAIRARETRTRADRN